MLKRTTLKAAIVNPLLLKGVKADITGQEFIYKGISCKIKLLGKNQFENAAAAIEAALALDVPYKAITEGIKKTCIRGRFHIANKSPLIVLDGAHNPDGVKAKGKHRGIFIRLFHSSGYGSI